jgi:hypothetical protein
LALATYVFTANCGRFSLSFFLLPFSFGVAAVSGRRTMVGGTCRLVHTGGRPGFCFDFAFAFDLATDFGRRTSLLL